MTRRPYKPRQPRAKAPEPETPAMDEPAIRLPRADDPALSRAEATIERRRRRTAPSTDPTLSRFNVPIEALDLEKYAYRSVPDTGLRLHQLTQNDDYEFVNVKGAQSKQDDEGVAKYRSGTNVDGQPQYSYLLRKLRKFADEDRAAAVARVDAEEKARLTTAPGDAPDQSYTPKR